jgi:5-methylcytosine-specific restriction endonuclease McrA
MIINKNASEIDISWKTAITGKHKPVKEDLTGAMRSSLDEQIFKFRKDNEEQCVLCSNTDKILEVDHIIHFDELVLNFVKYIENRNINIPKVLEIQMITHIGDVF